MLQQCLAKDKAVYPEGIISGYFGRQTKEAVIRFQEKYAKDILVPSGLKSGNGKVGPATRAKLNELCFPEKEKAIPLQITLYTGNESPLPQIAKILKDQWQMVGVETEIITKETDELIREIIRPRAYEVLLFGQVLGTIPDFYPFWHSSQTIDPGLNLTSFNSSAADAKLLRIRESIDPEEREKALADFQNIILQETPAIFLVQPDYIYFVSNKVKGVKEHIIPDPSKRFVGINKWYIETKRVLK